MSRTTDLNGDLETQTIDSTELVFQTQSPNLDGATSSGSSTNVPAIAGGAVAGVIVIVIIIMTFYFCLKRRKPRGDPDDNFDHDRLDTARFGGTATRPGAMPDVDLVGAEVTPFVYQPSPPSPMVYDPYTQMVQQPGMPAVIGEGSGHRRSDPYSWNSGPHSPTSETGQSLPGLHNTDYRGPSPGPSLGTSGTFPSSKERESASERTRLQVANTGSVEGGSSPRSSRVVQHLDAGRLQPQAAPEEIPPSYYSIPHDRGGDGQV